MYSKYQLFATSHMTFMVVGLIIGVTFIAMSGYITPYLLWKNKNSLKYFWILKQLLGSPVLYQNEKNGFAVWDHTQLKNSCLYSIEVRDMSNDDYILKISIKYNFKEDVPPMYERMNYDIGTHILSYTGDDVRDIIIKLWERMNYLSTVPPICSKKNKGNCISFTNMYEGYKEADNNKTKSFCKMVQYNKKHV